jgi:glycosyltransferase involved in cell wall biosynthesis
MNIAILAPSPVRFAMGGAEHLWLGLQRYLNEQTGHNCELFKFPSPGSNFREILSAYLEPARFDLDQFDVVLTGKDPAWFVEHADHRVWMLHKLRGVYDTYHFFDQPLVEEPASPSAKKAQQDLERIARTGAGPGKARKVVERLIKDIDSDRVADLDLRFPGPFTRRIIHLLDEIALSPQRIKRFAAISRTVSEREDYFPDGVDAVVAYPPPRMTGFTCKHPEHFFTVSRLDNAKRIDLIIREYRKVSGEVKLFIGGVGPALDDLRAAAAGDERIIFLGKLTDAQILDYYARSIAVPFTPYDEDYGLITVEAMRSSKPVLTLSDCGGVTELVRHGENGWCVPNKEGALTEAFEQALKDPDRTSELGRAAERSVRHITWENVAKTLLEGVDSIEPVAASSIQSRDRKPQGKLVVLSTFGIYPPRGGGQSRIFHLYSQLAERYDVTAVCLVGSHEEFIDRTIAPNFREIRIPKTDEHEAAEAQRSQEVDWVPITDIVAGELIGLTPLFGEVLAGLAGKTDAVVASGPYLIDVVAEHMPSVPLLYEAHNLEIELKRDILPKSDAGQKLLESVARVERMCWQSASLVFACASRDLVSLNSEYGKSLAVQIEVPNGFSTAETQFTSPSERRALSRAIHPSMKKSALFLGSWHGPNLSAVETILELAPLFDDVRFLLVGSACMAFQDREMPDNVVALGMVDEDEKALLLASASVALNPMTEGSGSNLKMLDYFGAGIPVVSTSFGARGLDAKGGTHFIVADDDQLIRTLCEFFSQNDPFEKMVREANALVLNKYSWTVIGSDFGSKLDQILASGKQSKA